MLFIGHSSYVKGDTTIASGTIDGTSIKWSVTSPDGTQENLKLSVTGSGAIPSYQSDFSPWEKYNHKTTEIYVAPTITEIGDYAFYETAITSFEIPSSCTRIGASAFLRCTNLKEIYIPSNVETIGALAFRGCTSLSLIHYDGRCTSNTIISSNVNDLGVANGKIIEKEGTGASYAFIPEGWEYYTHGEQCNGGAWVAESGTKLFFYAQKPNASVNYASAETLTSDQQDLPQYHPWRANSDKYTSIEINRNISTFGNYELMGYTDSNTGIVKGYSNLQTITVESENPIYIVGEDGALYNDVKSKLFLYPAQNPATHFDVPVTVGSIRPGTFCDAKNLQSISFLNALKNVWIPQHAFANASSLSYISFVSEAAPAHYYLSSFVGLPRDGVVVAPTETDEFKRLMQYITSAAGSNWTFCASSTGVGSYLSSDGTLYVLGKGEYTTSSEDASWYSQRSSIKKIVVKEGITNIGNYAFEDCSNVTEVTLNNSGTIGCSAFQNCSSLTRVNIGSGVSELKSDTIEVLSNLTLYRYPFKGCSKLTTINITDLKAFCAIKGLQYLTNSECGTAKTKEPLMINGYAYPSTRTLEIPEGVTSISPYAFRYFSNVTKIVIPSSVKDIPANNFYGHTFLTEVTLNNKGYIGHSAFQNCSSLTRVNIGSGVTELKSYTFEVSSNLTLYYYPFKGCSNLSTINVTDLKAYCAIKGLQYLTDSEYGTAKTKEPLMINDYAHPSTRTLEIPEGVTSISPYAFRYFSNVTKIVIPSSVKDIPAGNFSHHIYLTEVTLNNKGYIAELAFGNCSALSRVNIGSGVTELKSYTFEVSSNYTIYEYPFEGCSKLSTINVKDLKAYCAIKDLFYLTKSSYGTASNKTLMVNGSALSSTSVLEIPEGVTSIPTDAFHGFTNLTKIKIPSTVTSVGWDAFSYCSNLERIICKATTCPSVKGSIATNPGSITLKVPTGTASLYKSASIWQKFNVEEGKVITNNMDMKANKTTELAIPLKAISWSVSDESMASLTGDFASDGISRFVSSGDFVYDGTTEEPYKIVTITAKLEDFDTYIWDMKVYPSEITLTDGNAYLNTENVDVEKISYTRSFSKAGAWQALYLPFAFDVEEYKSDFDIAEIYAICPTNDTNGDGVLDSNDDKKFILAPLNTGSTQPNAPYMIRPKAAKSYTIVSENTTLASAKINEVEFATSRTQYSVKGIYAADFYAVPGDNNIYVTASGGFGYAKTKNVNIKPNRWVLHEESKNYCSSTSDSNSKLANFTIEVLGEDLDETTAIKLINGETASEGAKNGSAYNLNGMKVDASKNLPSGLYIINGKKVLKK